MLATTADPTDISIFNGSETNADACRLLHRRSGPILCNAPFNSSTTAPVTVRSSVQDSWKATPNLVINYGLRWDVARPWSDVYGRLTTPVPGEQSVKFPNSPPGNLVPGDPGVPSTSLPRAITIWRRVSVSPTHLQADCGARQARPAFVRLWYLLPWRSRQRQLRHPRGCSLGPLLGSPQPTPFASPYITRANGISQGQNFPFTFPSGPGPFPNFQFGSLMPLYVPGYYNHNKTTRRPSTTTSPSNGNSIRRQS